jgi:hypothetical protein
MVLITGDIPSMKLGTTRGLIPESWLQLFWLPRLAWLPTLVLPTHGQEVVGATAVVGAMVGPLKQSLGNSRPWWAGSLCTRARLPVELVSECAARMC